MSRRLSSLPRDGREGALIAYLMGGDPDAARSLEYARAVLRGGADALELGIPFSDPVADGPTIQRAGVRALSAGTSPADVLALAAKLRSEFRQPIVLMTYYNPVLRRGLGEFARLAREHGVDGVILPDVPFEESGPAREALEREGLDLVLLASPATGPERMDRIVGATRGFLYLVSLYGVTGARSAVSGRTKALVAEAKKRTEGRAHLAVGFGVSSPDQVRELREAGADGVIVGSALVRHVEEGASPAEVEAFVRSLKDATRL